MPTLNVSRGLVVVCAAAAAVAGGAARADVVATTMAAGPFSSTSASTAASASHIAPNHINLGVRSAVRFTVPSTQSYTLDSVVVAVGQALANVSENLLRVRVAADDGTGNRPGATVEVLSENEAVPGVANPFSSPTTFVSTTHPQLSAGVRYWIVLELTAWPSATANAWNVTYSWYEGSGTAPTISHQVQQNEFTPALPVGAWPTFVPNDLPRAFRVNGTPIVQQACCIASTGACGLAIPAQCESLGGTSIPLMFVCSPNPCQAGVGACCNGTTCTVNTAAGCGTGNAFLGMGTSCTPVTRDGHANACCPADFDASGGLAVADIFAMLNAWFAGCP
jgi:hypothetical protein